MNPAIAILAAALLLAACSDAADHGASLETPQQAAMEGEAPDAETAAPPPPLPNEFSRTAWRTRDESGAQYTTFLDPAGRYRDMRNGDPWQEGAWEYDDEDRICFTPDAEDALGQCWNPERMDDGGRMIVTSASGRRVRLESVEYRRPEAPIEIEIEGENEDEIEGEDGAEAS